jgi:hypothetical protein
MWQTCHEVVKKNSKIVPLGAPYNQPPRTLHITRSPGAEAFVETDHSRDCSSFVFCFRFILTWQIHWEQCCASSTQTEAELRFSKFSFVAVVGAAGVTLASASLAAPPLSTGTLLRRFQKCSRRRLVALPQAAPLPRPRS